MGGMSRAVKFSPGLGAIAENSVRSEAGREAISNGLRFGVVLDGFS